MPTLTLTPDTEWFSSMIDFRNLVGGVLAVVLVLSALALMVACTGLVFGKLAPQSGAAVSSDVLLRVVIGALVAASLSGIVTWSFSFDLNLGSFSNQGVPRAMFNPEAPVGPVLPGVEIEKCTTTVEMMTIACTGY